MDALIQTQAPVQVVFVRIVLVSVMIRMLHVHQLINAVLVFVNLEFVELVRQMVVVVLMIVIVQVACVKTRFVLELVQELHVRKILTVQVIIVTVVPVLVQRKGVLVQMDRRVVLQFAHQVFVLVMIPVQHAHQIQSVVLVFVKAAFVWNLMVQVVQEIVSAKVVHVFQIFVPLV